MTVLIVDDQTSVVSGIQSGVDWQAIGVDRVFTAYNATEAKRVVETRIVDILLCDIEMPAENGLSLLRWLRGQGYDAACIFLTAHADFSYARQALQLGSVDYIVQPARYSDIQSSLAKTIRRLKEKQETEQHGAFGRLISKRRAVLLNGLLARWLEGQAVDTDSILEDCKELGLPITRDTRLFYVILALGNWEEHRREWDESSLQYAFTNILSELLEAYGQEFFLVSLGGQRFALVLFHAENLLIDSEGMERQIRAFADNCRLYLNMAMACYITGPLLPGGLTDGIQGLHTVLRSNVAGKSGVFWADNTPPEKLVAAGQPFDGRRVSLLLTSGFTQSAREETAAYLRGEREADRLTPEALQVFYQEFLRGAHVALESKGLQINEFFNDETLLRDTTAACGSLSDMKVAIDAIFSRFDALVSESRDDQNLVDRVTRYVQNNIEKNLHRTDIAEEMFLNADYLSRVFKKQTGKSLMSYITEEKMRFARTLLRTTPLPVGDIAARVGYTNFSHFSKSYKKINGCSPAGDRAY